MADLEKEKKFLQGLSSNSQPMILKQGLHSYDLLKMFGLPEAKEMKQLRTKTVEVYKYKKHGRGYLLKITLDNGVVVAWEDRR